MEKTINITQIPTIELYGVHNKNFELIKSYFPKLKMNARGAVLKLNGSQQDIDQFEMKLDLMINHIERYKRISTTSIERIMEGEKTEADLSKDQVIVYGNGGNLIKAQTPNQQKMVKAVDKTDMIFAIGPAGTGKTYTAVALAVRALKDREVRKIILTRPAVEAGENIGFLPGDIKEKLDPYMQPLYDALRDMIPAEKLREYMENGVIQIAPLGFMRGRTLDKAFVILDEAQNATKAQFKMFLTRMGRSAKFIINGDLTQVDLPRHQQSGLVEAMRVLKGIKDISFIYLDDKDVIRHDIVRKILKAYEKEENKIKDQKENSK